MKSGRKDNCMPPKLQVISSIGLKSNITSLPRESNAEVELPPSYNMLQSGQNFSTLTGTPRNEDFYTVPEKVLLPLEPREKYENIKFKDSVLRTLQMWEGTVEEVNNDEFTSVLIDKTDSQNPDEQVTFSVNEVTENERNMISPGSTFYWVIGHEIMKGGQQKNVAYIRFRRMPNWTGLAMKHALQNAEISIAELDKAK